MLRNRIKHYLIDLKLIFAETKSPLSVVIKFGLKLRPYNIILKSENNVISGTKNLLIEKMMEAYIVKNSSNSKFVWTNKGKVYTLSGFNSPATIFSTFFYEDWKKLNVKEKSVLDIGGYVGDTAIYFIARGAKRVVLYEAYPYSYKIAKSNVDDNNLADKIEVNNCAIGGEDSFIVIDPNYENNNESAAVSSLEGIKVPLTSLKSICDKYNINGWILKMNCEGCEYDVFKNTDLDTLRKFSEIYMHYHGSPLPLVDKLKKAGFRTVVHDYIFATRGT